jgi:hypothetical protein
MKGDQAWPPAPNVTVEEPRTVFRPLRTLLTVLLVSTVVDVLVDGGTTIANLAGFDGVIPQFAGIFQTLAPIVVLVVFLMMQYRLYANLAAFRTRGLTSTPGWLVAYNLLPIVSLWKPFQLLHEIWDASDPNVDSGDPAAWEAVPHNPLINLCWALEVGIATVIVCMALFVLKLSMPAVSSGSISAFTASMTRKDGPFAIFGAVITFIAIVQKILYYQLMAQLTARQNAKEQVLLKQEEQRRAEIASARGGAW